MKFIVTKRGGSPDVFEIKEGTLLEDGSVLFHNGKRWDPSNQIVNVKPAPLLRLRFVEPDGTVVDKEAVAVHWWRADGSPYGLDPRTSHNYTPFPVDEGGVISAWTP